MNTTIHNTPAGTVTAAPGKIPYLYIRKDAVYAVSALALGWLFVRSFIFSGACLGAFIFTLAAVALGICFIGSAGKLTAKALIGGAVTLILAAPTLFSANYDMRLLAGFSAFASYIVWITYSFGLMPDSDFGGMASILSGVFARPFSRFADVWRAVGGGMRDGAGKKLLTSLLGLTTAVPLTFIVLINLAQADEVFENKLDELVGNISDRMIVNTVSVMLGILVAMYLFGLLSASRSSAAPKKEQKRFIPAGFALSLTIPLMLCYAAFFAVQLPYYLSAFGGVLPDGYSFSEYAVKGFFELVRVAVINAAVCLAVTLFADGRAVRRSVVTILGVMTLILLATAASKLYLYIDAYSLTLKRVYAAIALIFIAVFFILMIIRQYTDRLRLTAAALILCALFSVTMTFPDWDGVVAGSLIDKAMDGAQSDLTAAETLSRSPKVTESLIRAAEDGSRALSEAAIIQLNNRKMTFDASVSDQNTVLDRIICFNIGEYMSYGMIKDYYM